jgi:hypothetical protein
MRLLALSFIAVAFAGFTSAKPTTPFAAIHGHKLQPKPAKTSAAAKPAKTSAAAAVGPKVFAAAVANDGNTPFSLSGPKFVSYIDNTVSNLSSVVVWCDNQGQAQHEANSNTMS